MEVLIRYHEDSEMMEITKDGEQVFFGNYWDFSREPQSIKKFLNAFGIKAKIKKEKDDMA